MKAKYIISALAAVAMIGCNKTEKVAAPKYITVSSTANLCFSACAALCYSYRFL